VWDNPRRNLREVSWYFHTKSSKELGILYQYFYKNKVKILPQDIFKLLNPRSLAIWFMDDGSNNRTGLTLNTHSFPKKDQEHITRFLLENYSIETHIVKDRTKWKIAIGKDKKRFLEIVKPFVIPSMIYKVVYPRNDLFVR